MSAWDDLSPAVKRYAIVALVVLAGLLAFRSCGSSSGAPASGTTGARGR